MMSNPKIICNKVCYSTKEFADLDIIRIIKKSTRTNVPKRSYKCKKCNTWHLTKTDDIKTVLEINLSLVEENKKLKLENKKLSKVSPITNLNQKLKIASLERKCEKYFAVSEHRFDGSKYLLCHIETLMNKEDFIEFRKKI